MDDGIEILGTRYSSKIRALYDQVKASFKLPITITAIAGHVDNTIEVRPSDIHLRLKPGSTEDNVAHELMHGILRSEGFPQMFSIMGSTLCECVRSITASDFDHLVINQRLLQLGYDARRGYLSKADSFHKVLELRANKDPDSQTKLLLVLLHEMMKFCFYIGDSRAESEIQGKFPAVRSYWRQLAAVIKALPQTPSPLASWTFVRTYLQTANQIAHDQSCSTRPSDFIGFEPIFLSRAAALRKAREIFEMRVQRLPDNSALARLLAKDGGVLIGAGKFAVLSGAENVSKKLALASLVEFTELKPLHFRFQWY